MRLETAEAAMFLRSAALAMLCSSTMATNSCRVTRSILAVIALSRFEEAPQFPVGLFRTFFLQVMSRRHSGGTFDPRSVMRPHLGRIVVAPDPALLAPQDHGRAVDLLADLEIGGVHVEVDAEGGAIVLAHAVDGLRVLDAADVFGER